MIRRPPRSPLFPYTTLSGSVGEVTAARRQPAIELLPIAPLLVERDELHAALTDAALDVTAARRQQPPLGGVVPARDHVRASRTRQVKDGARTSWCTIRAGGAAAAVCSVIARSRKIMAIDFPDTVLTRPFLAVHRRAGMFSPRPTRGELPWQSRIARSPPSSPCSLHPRSARKRRSEEHTSELQSPCNLVCRLLLEKKKKHTQPRR